MLTKTTWLSRGKRATKGSQLNRQVVTGKHSPWASQCPWKGRWELWGAPNPTVSSVNASQASLLITVFLNITLRNYLDSLGFMKKKKKKIKVRSLGKIRLGASGRRLKLVFCLHAWSWEPQEHLTVGTHHCGDNLCQIEALHWRIAKYNNNYNNKSQALVHAACTDISCPWK